MERTTKVSEVMTRDVITVTVDTPIHKAARLMVDHGVSGLPVVDELDRLIGIVTEADLIVRQRPGERISWWRAFFEDPERLARDYQKRAGTTVGEVMTREVISVSPDGSLETAAFLLDHHRVRRLPVAVDGDLVGIVSRADVIKALAAAPPAAPARTDAELEAEMRARIADEPWAHASSLVVRASGGVLSVWGTVTSQAERSALTTMARAIEGSQGVDNNVVVTPDLAYHYGV